MKSESFDFDKLNPGEELRKYISQLIPKGNLQIDDGRAAVPFIDKIDWLYKHEGDYFDLVYQSSINFLLRRIVKSGHYFKNKSLLFDNYNYIDEIRNFLSVNTRFDSEEIEKVLGLVVIIIDYADNKPSSKTRKTVFSHAKDNNEPCYICGRDINYYDSESWEFVQLEHIWPKGMGGANTLMNLKIACKKCNKYKEEYLDTSDYHFEHITYKTALEDNQKHQEFKYTHKIAVWAKNNFKCVICDRGALEVGPLKFKRKNPDDTWHFLNIDSFCDDHYDIENINND